MLKQRSRGATVFCALLPGAGHMYMGFMKRGVSFMGLFFLILFLVFVARHRPADVSAAGPVVLRLF